MRNLASGLDAKISSYSSELSADILVNLKFTKSHPYTRALLLLLAQRAPLDLTNGSAVDLGESLSSFNRKEYHHIFPRAFLRARGVTADKANSLCNFCFLPAGSNKRISSKQPSDYIFNLVPESNRKQILESNMMPLRMEIYSNNNYDDFISNRAQLIGQFVDSLVV